MYAALKAPVSCTLNSIMMMMMIVVVIGGGGCVTIGVIIHPFNLALYIRTARVPLCRLSITDHDQLGQNPFLFGQRNNDVPRDWIVNGYYKPSSLQAVSGSFQVGVREMEMGWGGVSCRVRWIKE